MEEKGVLPRADRWRLQPLPNYVTHLECSGTGEKVDKDAVHNLSPQGYPLLVRYDLERIKATLSKQDLLERPQELWRYRELLPIQHSQNIVSLGEIVTPIITLPTIAQRLSTAPIYVKDEGRLPTGSFKARGLVMAVSKAKELGIKSMAMPSNGNAGAALAAYCSRAGIESYIFCPEDTPTVNIKEIALQGGKIFKVNGLIGDCGKLVAEGKKAGRAWFDASTLKEPYRIEGKKTMGLELAEQFDWELPDVIFYPTGGGTGLIGMWKGFQELEALGWLKGKKPRMVAVQASGCAPIVKAFEEGKEKATLWENAHTIASGIRVPAAIGDFLIIRAVKESGGFALAVDDSDIEAAQTEVAKEEGLLLCPEGAATFAAFKKALREGLIKNTDSAVLFNCASGLKYPMPEAGQFLDRHKPIDYSVL